MLATRSVIARVQTHASGLRDRHRPTICIAAAKAIRDAHESWGIAGSAIASADESIAGSVQSAGLLLLGWRCTYLDDLKRLSESGDPGVSNLLRSS